MGANKFTIKTESGREKSVFDFLDENFIAKNLKETLEQQRQVWIKTLKESLEEVNRVSSGNLSQSIDVIIEDEGDAYSFKLVMDDYWKFVDEGRQKGGKQPPEKAMLEFIALRGITPRKKTINADKDRKSLAFAMAKSIKDNGIKATNFYTDEKDGLIKGLFLQIEKDAANYL